MFSAGTKRYAKDFAILGHSQKMREFAVDVVLLLRHGKDMSILPLATSDTTGSPSAPKSAGVYASAQPSAKPSRAAEEPTTPLWFTLIGVGLMVAVLVALVVSSNGFSATEEGANTSAGAVEAPTPRAAPAP